VSAISDKVVQAEAEQVHRPERADERERHRHRRNDRAGEVAEEEEDHQDHQHDGQHELELHVLDRGPDGRGAVAQHGELHRRGEGALEVGNRRLMRSTTSMTLAPGWRWTLTRTAGWSFIHAACFTFSASSSTVATSERTTGAPFR